MAERYVPCGDIVWLEFDPQAGHEQGGRRPALVISPRSYNAKVGLGLFCPITHQIKNYPFEVALPRGLKAKGVVLADQLKSLDWTARDAKRICEAPQTVVNAVLTRLTPILANP